MKAAAFTCCAVVVLGLTATMQAAYADPYSDELDIQRTRLSAFIAILRAEIDAHGDAYARQAQAKTAFDVSSMRLPNAWVVRVSPDHYQVQITPSYRLLATYITDVDVIASVDFSIMDCRTDYVAFLYRTLRAAGENGDNAQIPSPEGFFSSDSKCAAYVGRFPIPQQYGAGRDQVVDLIVELAYLHELGHVQLQHSPVDISGLPQVATAESMRQFITLMRRSQDQENQADLWGVARVAPNPYVMVNNAFFGFFMAFGGADCSNQFAQDHPNGFQRYSRMVQYMNSLAAQTTNIPLDKKQQMTGIIQDMSKIAAKAQTLLHCSV